MLVALAAASAPGHEILVPGLGKVGQEMLALRRLLEHEACPQAG